MASFVGSGVSEGTGIVGDVVGDVDPPEESCLLEDSIPVTSSLLLSVVVWFLTAFCCSDSCRSLGAAWEIEVSPGEGGKGGRDMSDVCW